MYLHLLVLPLFDRSTKEVNCLFRGVGRVAISLIN